MSKIIISGGGSGGHIFPALAIANQLKKDLPNAEILFVGAKGKMEMEKVPKAGYKIHGLWISGIQRKLTIKNLMFPLKLISSLFSSYRIIKKYKPDIAIGVGGFASGPLLRVAAFCSVPTLIQEQNSFPGITNRWLSSKVDRICVSYENMERFFPEEKIVKTGNPVRMEMVNITGKRKEACAFFNIDPNKKTVLIVGGSLGARSINQAVAMHANSLNKKGIQVIWQTGKFYFEDIKSRMDESSIPHVKIMQFIERMDLAYAAADLVVSRAGAMSISELCLVEKASILVPSPNVSEDHQTKNANALVENHAAIIVKDSEIQDKLLDVIDEVLNNVKTLKSLSNNIAQMADVNATTDITKHVLELMNK